MTEKEWLDSSDLYLLLRCIRDRTSDRKPRLFACACCRRFWAGLGSSDQAIVELAERLADRLADDETVTTVRRPIDWKEKGPAKYTIVEQGWRSAWNTHEGLARAVAEASGSEATKRALASAGATAEEAWSAAERAGPAAFTTAFDSERVAQLALLRDIVGNPFRPPPPIPAAVLSWNDGSVVKLATAIYEERDFSPASMGVLADAWRRRA
jgi:hypothetical protein